MIVKDELKNMTRSGCGLFLAFAWKDRGKLQGILFLGQDSNSDLQNTFDICLS
jgi:hypothetical protein